MFWGMAQRKKLPNLAVGVKIVFALQQLAVLFCNYCISQFSKVASILMDEVSPWGCEKILYRSVLPEPTFAG
jgi:hypothetical protein